MLLSQRLLLALLLVMAPAAVAAPDGRATVLSIGDGDTIRVQQGQQRIMVLSSDGRHADSVDNLDAYGSGGNNQKPNNQG